MSPKRPVARSGRRDEAGRPDKAGKPEEDAVLFFHKPT